MTKDITNKVEEENPFVDPNFVKPVCEHPRETEIKEADRIYFEREHAKMIGQGELIPGKDFYIPQTRAFLKNWLRDYCEKTEKKLPKKFSKMKKDQLYAIYFNIMGKA